MLKNSIYKMRYYAACPTFFQESNSTTIVNEIYIKKKMNDPSDLFLVVQKYTFFTL